ncbi:hypothetical protein L202_05958 [Cryptococcus amylolentus CBS 6039]|uniref:Replication factor C subunit 1 n=1 Tax=Cryptococcus amylolentus CBS 6039 TaxID=1295533 RepID=A0A1E3HI17_9TREE|nr:hypothetical protein L202_05958 [Cryptococcus amylolentus CBS 6039]ODN75992.1 hypothetical protein L202_05958 [Cryptococcus amylolentus CBS 6039]
MSSKQRPSESPKKKPSPKKEEAAGKDIRGFFNKGGSQKSTTQTSKSGSGKMPITIDDSDDEPAPPTKASSSKPAPKSSGASKATSSRPIVLSESEDDEPARKPVAKPAFAPDPAPSAKPKPAMSRPSLSRPAVKSAPKRKTLMSDSESEEDVKPAPKRQSLGKKKVEEDYKPMDVDDDEEEEEEEEEEEVKPAPKKAPAKKPAASPAKKPTPVKKPAAKAAPKPSAKETEGEKKANNWKAVAAARAAGPSAPGSKDIPEGEGDCLSGLTFVFTGELESLGREEAQELVRRFSGKCTTAPSGKTSFVVVGANAGPSKLAKIKEKNIPMLTEDEFIELVRQRSNGVGVEVDPATLEKAQKAREKEAKKIEDQAKEMEAREKKEEQERKRKEKALGQQGMAVKKIAPPSSQLWTTKYAPASLKEICGNKAPVERLGKWLEDWDASYKVNFKKPGKDGMGTYRAVLISGPPGIGKTTSAHLMAKNAGYSPLELNASDTRSKKLIENETNVDNRSLDGYFKGQGIGEANVAGMKITSKTCLIMDEVDGMSAGDRGGVGALNTLIKKTKIPMILICNDRTLQKMKPLHTTTFNMTFKRPTPPEIRSRIMSILYKEKLKIPSNVVDELIKGVGSDIRQVLNMLSTFKLSKSEMDFDESKELIKVNEKNTIMTPFTLTDKLCNPYAFSKTNKDTLSDKMELYFQDFSFMPLFMQEHYPKTNPSKLQNLNGREKDLKNLELLSKAADSVSDGDLVDRMIHGSEQQWSLLPFHAVVSTVLPASLIYGAMRPSGGGYGSWGPAFPQWLGQNSKQTKLARQLTDIQIRMRLRASGSRSEIREQYMPMLANKIVMPIVENGADALDETIEYMDGYFLGKDDWDAFVELGVDTMKEDLILKKIPGATKSAFTRQYNKQDHPIAFHKSDMFAVSKKKIADQGPAPDNEDVFEGDQPVPDDPDDDKDDDDADVAKDKLVKAVKPKGKGKAAAAKPKAKAPAKSKAKK